MSADSGEARLEIEPCFISEDPEARGWPRYVSINGYLSVGITLEEIDELCRSRVRAEAKLGRMLAMGIVDTARAYLARKRKDLDGTYESGRVKE